MVKSGLCFVFPDVDFDLLVNLTHFLFLTGFKKGSIRANFKHHCEDPKNACVSLDVLNNNGPVLLKWLFYRTETVNKCVWLRTAMMEMVSNLETSSRFFSSFYCSQAKLIVNIND